MLRIFLILIFASVWSCSGSQLKKGMTASDIANIIGKADSLIVLPDIKDVYTNKPIHTEQWFYGKDSILQIENGKLKFWNKKK
ncbi:MAG: hypothetical protein JXR60_04530 [Bacteroidales bacterium]|nr:hypothetical protein [Bacteroidales bacterium]